MSSVGAGTMGGAVGAGASRAGPKLADLKDSRALRQKVFPSQKLLLSQAKGQKKNRTLVTIIVSGSMVNNDAFFN